MSGHYKDCIVCGGNTCGSMEIDGERITLCEDCYRGHDKESLQKFLSERPSKKSSRSIHDPKMCHDCAWSRHNLKEGKWCCVYCYPERTPACILEWMREDTPWLGRSGGGEVFGLPVEDGYESCDCYEKRKGEVQ